MSDLLWLLKAIKLLGLKLGWKYWRFYRRAQKDPEFVRRWAINCRKHFIANPSSWYMLRWAEALEQCYAQHPLRP